MQKFSMRLLFVLAIATSFQASIQESYAQEFYENWVDIVYDAPDCDLSHWGFQGEVATVTLDELWVYLHFYKELSAEGQPVGHSTSFLIQRTPSVDREEGENDRGKPYSKIWSNIVDPVNRVVARTTQEKGTWWLFVHHLNRNFDLTYKKELAETSRGLRFSYLNNDESTECLLIPRS